MVRNCPEWIISELGMFMFSMVSVPLNSKLGPGTVSYILAECQVAVVIVHDEAGVRSVLECGPKISVIVTMRDIRHTDILRTAANLNIKIIRCVGEIILCEIISAQVQ